MSFYCMLRVYVGEEQYKLCEAFLKDVSIQEFFKILSVDSKSLSISIKKALNLKNKKLKSGGTALLIQVLFLDLLFKLIFTNILARKRVFFT